MTKYLQIGFFLVLGPFLLHCSRESSKLSDLTLQCGIGEDIPGIAVSEPQAGTNAAAIAASESKAETNDVEIAASASHVSSQTAVILPVSPAVASPTTTANPSGANSLSAEVSSPELELTVETFDGRWKRRNAIKPYLPPAALLDRSFHSPEFPAGMLDESGTKVSCSQCLEKVDCTLGKELGTGSYGAVFECLNEQTAEQTAVKFISGGDKVAISKNEYQFQQEIQGEHVVKAKAAFTLTKGGHVLGKELKFEDIAFTAEPGTLVIVMELVPFELYNLLYKEFLIDGKHVRDLKWTMRVWLQVLDGVRSVHRAGFMWRDMKPENILCTSSNKTDMIVKITDFGLCAHSAQEQFDYLGTPEYMAPEQHARKGYTEQIDVWGLGILLYELYYGTLPFAKVSDFSHGVEFPAYKKTEDHEAREHFKSLIRKLLQHSPDERPRILDKEDSESSPILADEDLKWLQSWCKSPTNNRPHAASNLFHAAKSEARGFAKRWIGR